MGQYYYPVISKNGKDHFAGLRAEYRGGLKLTEHVWWKNSLCNGVAQKIYREPAHVWWVGDYSVDKVENVETGDYEISPDTPAQLCQVYEAAHGENAELSECSAEVFDLTEAFLVNHTRKIYMDCEDFHRRMSGKCSWTDDPEMVMHPLPLLTAIGNGKGGGDYFGPHKEDIGAWAGDLISIEEEAPEGYAEVKYTFFE